MRVPRIEFKHMWKRGWQTDGFLFTGFEITLDKNDFATSLTRKNTYWWTCSTLFIAICNFFVIFRWNVQKDDPYKVKR
jgi:hypothetical protein